MRLSSRARLALTLGVMIVTALAVFYFTLRPVVLSVRILDPGPVIVGSAVPLKAELKVRYPGTRNHGETRLEPAGQDSLTWTSSDTAVATVSASGVLTAVSPGNARVTASARDSGRKDSVTVTVMGPRP
jgi:hypothetical protein